MVFCPSCGKENPEDANFCKVCGTAVKAGSSGWVSEDFDQRVNNFAKEMERYGKEASRRAEVFGRDLVSDMERFVRGRSVCPECGTSWPGVHDYCAKCGSRIT